MDSSYVLIFGVMLLACGFAGLACVRLCSPKLKGLEWMAASFGSSALGTWLLLIDTTQHRPGNAVAANLCILLGFVFLHIAFVALHENLVTVPRIGSTLLLAQGVVGAAALTGVTGPKGQFGCLCVLVAVQLAETTNVLRLAHHKSKSIVFSGVVLLGFALLAGGRAGWLSYGFLKNGTPMALDAMTYMVYITGFLGVGFGFFWMNTDTISSDLEMIANTDPLTRLYNRRAFRQWGERELDRSARRNRPFSILMLDLDHFKKINDQFGHQVGDTALCAAVEQMQDSVRGIDVLGRWGGEEFIVLLPGASREATMIVAQRLRLNVAKVFIGQSGKLHRIQELLCVPEEMRQLSVSIGAGNYKGKGDTLEAVLQRADEALYEAKSTGRNKVIFDA